MVSRRDVLTTAAGIGAFASPLLASANDYDSTILKARATFGQKVLGLTDASPEAILDNRAALETYVTQMIRASGKRNVDGRSLGGTPLGDAAVAAVKAAKAGDKAGANAAIKDIVAMTKLKKIAPYGSPDNPNQGGVSFTSMSGTRGTAGSW